MKNRQIIEHLYEKALTKEQPFDIMSVKQTNVQEGIDMRKIVSWISSKKTLIIISIILISVMYLCITKKDTPDSKASNASQKYYTCITVENGDTLWEIAETYKTEEYGSTKEYIAEVMSINNLESDNIQAGTNLLIPYYEVKSYQ